MTGGYPTTAAEAGSAQTGPVTGPALAWLALRPRDTVFVRDGRSFDAANDVTGASVWPWPSTVAGAVFNIFDRKEPGVVCGPVLARATAGGGWSPHFPVPLDVVTETDRHAPDALRLRYHRFDGDTDLGGTGGDSAGGVEGWLAPGSHTGAVDRISGWLSAGHLAAYLAGELPGPDGTPLDELDIADPVHPEHRIGLARQPGTRQAREGFLYQAAHLRLTEGWAILVGHRPAPGLPAPASAVRLGGQSRLADVTPAAGVAWPARPRRFPGGRVLVYVATPAIWPDGWRIPVPSGARLTAAATGRPQAVATTSPRDGWRRSRALRWAVPAGSVYLLTFDDEAAAAAWAAGTHGTAYGRTADDRLRTAGFGVVLTGVWS